jgi:AraC-like DNA-binding protein
MTYYSQQVQHLTRQLYGKQYLTERIIWAKHFMEANASASLDLNQIARQACLSKFHFIRLFRCYYGCTPHQFLIQTRISQAKNLLQQGLTVIDACGMVGFDSVSSFTRLFRKITGCSPLLYQRKWLLKKAILDKGIPLR